MRILQVLLIDLARLLSKLPFWILDLVWICSMVGLAISAVAMLLVEAHTGKFGFIAYTDCFPGVFLRRTILTYIESVAERAAKARKDARGYLD